MLEFLFKKQSNQPIYLFNTLSREKEIFKPIKKGKVLFYQCGPTVYWTQHIGNMRAMIMADLINRTFKYFNYNVRFVRNYTDVGHLTSDQDFGEDKMEKASTREGLKPEEIAEKYIKVFENDVKELNTIIPNYRPRATSYVGEIIKMVQILLDKDFAYSTDLAIYFDISKAKDYTKLSRQNLEENISGAGSAGVEDPNKKHPADFSVWFFKAGSHKNALQFWESPFSSPLVKNGEGFPGWHIECSAMTRKLLGKTIDIHMGGIEHIPVHHTNEIAQSEAVNGVPLADYWLHNEWLVTNNSKMAKSEGTSFSLTDIKEKGFDPLALRFLFLQAHYRSRQNFTWEALEAAQKGYNNLLNSISSLGSKIGTVDRKYKEKFLERIADDFNISLALATLFEILKSNISNADKLATALDFDKVFGLELKKVSEKDEVKTDIPEEIQKLVDERKTARANKDWKKSDELREKVKSLGFEVKDTPEGQEILKI
jgi:cysteinyl-tRNA synthetase